MKKAFCLSALLVLALTTAAAQSHWPQHTVQDMRGRSRSLRDYAPERGVTLFVFWKTCCPNNITMINELNEVWLRYDDPQRPVRVVLVSVDDQRTASRVRPVVGSNGWEWEVIMDRNRDLARSYNVTMPPQWVAVDPAGKVVYQRKVTNGALDPAIYFDELITEMNKFN